MTIATTPHTDLEMELQELDRLSAPTTKDRRRRNQVVRELRRRNLRIDNGQLERELAEAFQGVDSMLLAIALERGLNFDRLAKDELANRGLNGQGEWVGFEQARRIHQSRKPAPRPCPCGRMTINDCAGECGFSEGTVKAL